MTVTGYALGARHEEVGTELVADTPAGSTALVVQWAGLFNDEGGTLDLNGTPLDYATADDETDTITLVDPLVTAATEGDRVLVVDGGQVRVDYVLSVDLGDGDAITVPIPYAQRDLWPEGDYDDPVQVVLSDDLTTLVDVPGRTPVRDAAYIDPETLPSTEPTEPPATSPTPTVVAGSGAAVVRWDPVDLAETYDLHVALTDTAPPSAATLHTANAHSPTWVTQVGGVPATPDRDLYFALVARNAVDAAAPSSWVVGRAGAINDAILAASLAVVQNVVAELVETAGLSIGGQTWNNTTGLTIPDVLNFPPNDSTAAQVWANLVARSLTVEDRLKINGSLNELSAGAQVALASAVTDPKAKPTVASWWPTKLKLAAPPGPGGQVPMALIPDPGVAGGWIVVFSGDTHPWVVRYSATGAVTQSAQVSGGTGAFTETPQGAVYSNVTGAGRIYMVTKDESFSAPWKMLVLDSGTFAKVAEYVLATSSTWFTKRPLVAAFNSTYLRLTGFTSATVLTERRYAFATPGTWDSSNAYSGTLPSAFDISGVTLGTPGYNNTRESLIRETADAVVFDTFRNRVTGSDWPRPFGKAITASSGNNLIDRDLNIYTVRTDLPSGEVAYSFRDSDPGGTGEHETGLSPLVTLSTSTVSRGAGVAVTPTPPPDTGDPDAPDLSTVYWRSSSAVAWRQQGDASSTTARVTWTEPNLGSTQHGSRPTFASAGIVPGKIVSSANADASGPLVQLNGDGSWRLGTLSGSASGVVTDSWRGKMEWWTSTATTSLANATTTQVGGFTLTSGGGLTTISGGNSWTITEAGVYLINFTVTFASSAAGRRIAFIYVGSTESRRQDVGSGGSATVQVSHLARIGAGVSLNVRAYQNTGAALALASAPGHDVQIVRVGNL